jgi:glycosyltransferase involved in cell wall biosynthesis
MPELIFYIVFAIMTLLGVYAAFKLMFAFKHFSMRQLLTPNATKSTLPSVSVCIPARNETYTMTQCLEHVIASRYPKLEIIVLDDGSRDDTSILIKSYAHAGVRFVEGSALPDGWLGKNHALQGLLHEASGSYVLYMDVDTIIAPDTIGQLVAYMEQEKATMISVLPTRGTRWLGSAFFGTLRYAWELLLHRKTAPATSSSAWMIHRHSLRDSLGGFEPHKDDIQPETRLAAALASTDAYRFLIGTPMIGVSYEKQWSSQVETSIRLLYPFFGGQPLRAVLTMLLLLLLNLPVIILIFGLFDGWTLIQTMALWQLSVFTALYGLFLDKVWHKGWWLGIVLWPVVIAQEFVLFAISTSRYMRRTVTWKGRPVTTASPQSIAATLPQAE